MLACVNDSPISIYQKSFQDPSSLGMEGIYTFNLHLLYIITNIILFVGWLLAIIFLIFINYQKSNINKFFHSNIIEIVWTIIPCFILLSLTSPSFSLLYSLDELINAILTVKVIAHQWYWMYQIHDYNTCFFIESFKAKTFKFSCYLLNNDFLKKASSLGLFRLLETNKRVILPSKIHIRLLITSADVLHSWAIPSFGIKLDACPGRLNQTHLFIKRSGMFFGQCSEICGTNHAFMPITINSCHSKTFYYTLNNS